MNIIEFENFKKHFGQTRAVDGLNLSIEEGELFGFLGPNGAGKTTTISCMMGFTKPTSGKISLFGKDSWNDRTEIKRDIGYLSADVKFYPDLTGKDHIELYKSIQGRTSHVTKLVDDFDFDVNKKVGVLSTGNKQKLGIILCLMYEPKLLVLDEPTRGLDPISQRVFYQYILEMKKRGVTIFMSSHNLTEVQKYCDHIGIIKKGKLIAVEDIESMRSKQLRKVKVVFERPISAFTLPVKGVKELEAVAKDHYTFDFEGNLNELLIYLAKYQIADIEVTHSDLDEIFDKYYK